MAQVILLVMFLLHNFPLAITTTIFRAEQGNFLLSSPPHKTWADEI